jgi:AcrR family transcriptional regulator
VVEAAAALADEEGLEGVTLAALAARLGIRTPSLYNHVAGLEGLRRELAVHGTRELTRALGRSAVGKSGDAAVEAMSAAYRTFVRERPGLYAATVRSAEPTVAAGEDPELRVAQGESVAVVLDVLSGYGFKGDDALHAARGWRSIVHGFATLEAAGGFGLPQKTDESFRRLVRSFVRGLRSPEGRKG